MRYHRSLSFSLFLVCCLVAAGKDKKKVLLPTDVLEAKKVLVVADPEAGVAIDAPSANRTVPRGSGEGPHELGPFHPNHNSWARGNPQTLRCAGEH